MELNWNTTISLLPKRENMQSDFSVDVLIEYEGNLYMAYYQYSTDEWEIYLPNDKNTTLKDTGSVFWTYIDLDAIGTNPIIDGD
jgi:hypothetical protein